MPFRRGKRQKDPARAQKAGESKVNLNVVVKEEENILENEKKNSTRGFLFGKKKSKKSSNATNTSGGFTLFRLISPMQSMKKAMSKSLTSSLSRKRKLVIEAAPPVLSPVEEVHILDDLTDQSSNVPDDSLPSVLANTGSGRDLMKVSSKRRCSSRNVGLDPLEKEVSDRKIVEETFAKAVNSSARGFAVSFEDVLEDKDIVQEQSIPPLIEEEENRVVSGVEEEISSASKSSLETENESDWYFRSVVLGAAVVATSFLMHTVLREKKRS